jgi:hypothetical protein
MTKTPSASRNRGGPWRRPKTTPVEVYRPARRAPTKAERYFSEHPSELTTEECQALYEEVDPTTIENIYSKAYARVKGGRS